MAESKNTTIVANIKAISDETKKLAVDAKSAAAEAKLLARELNAGISGATVTKVREAYGSAIESVSASIKKYEESIKKFKADRDALQHPEGEDLKAYNQLTNKIAAYQTKLVQARDQLVALTEEQKKYSESVYKTAEALEEEAKQQEKVARTNERLTKISQGANKAAKILTGVLTALLAVYMKNVRSAIELNTELYSLSKRYNTNVEEIQRYNIALKLATGQSDLFTQSLSVLAKGMSDIAGNRGQKYTAALRAVGTSYQELSELSRSEQFQTIVNGLMEIENESIRAAHAQTLLGESGQYIVGALQNNTMSLQDYLKEAEKYSVVTKENAAKLAQLGFQMDYIKSEINVQTAQLTINAMPAIEKALNLLNAAIKVMSALAKHSWLLWTAISAILILKVVSVVSGWIVAIRTASAAMKAATITAVTFKAALLGVVAILGAVVVGIAATGAKAKQSTEEINKMGDAIDNLNDMNGDYDANIEQVRSYTSEKTAYVYVDIAGHGDNPIGDANASTVAALTTEQVQKALGDLIRS